jgi:hypothetical protein
MMLLCFPQSARRNYNGCLISRGLLNTNLVLSNPLFLSFKYYLYQIMRYRLLRTFLLTGAIYLTVARGIAQTLGYFFPLFSPLLGTYYLVFINVIAYPICYLLQPQVAVYLWLLGGRDSGMIHLLILLGGVFWGLVFSRREYLKLKKNQLKTFASSKSSITQEPYKTKNKVLSIFWVGFLSVEVIFYLRILISWLIGIKISRSLQHFQETDCSLSSTIDNLLSLTPIHCTARKYFSHPDFFIYKSEGSEPSDVGAYFTDHNAVTFLGDCLLWGLIFSVIYYIAIKLWSLLRPPSGEPQTNLNDQRIP